MFFKYLSPVNETSNPDQRPHELHRETFRTGSKTYFNSSRFFPPRVRADVYILYGFVRVADNLVDQVPQDRIGFEDFVTRYRRALRGETTGDIIIDSFVELARRRSFDPDWAEAFLRSMRMDLDKHVHASLRETLEYVYGSAEVIGLFMSRIMELSPRAERHACLLGRAMQFINFIRDIDEDNRLGRIYLPISETPLPDLARSTVTAREELYRTFIEVQLDRYRKWQAEAEEGYYLIPRRYRIPIKTAGDMYNWTARKIADDPMIVFDRKVKPSRGRIVFTGLMNAITC
jgi:15-cis-phytoene synthase